MSFSSEVKEELAKHIGKSRHCQLAELAALIAFECRVNTADSENPSLRKNTSFWYINCLRITATLTPGRNGAYWKR